MEHRMEVAVAREGRVNEIESLKRQSCKTKKSHVSKEKSFLLLMWILEKKNLKQTNINSLEKTISYILRYYLNKFETFGGNYTK
jgi:hypothetical protein